MPRKPFLLASALLLIVLSILLLAGPTSGALAHASIIQPTPTPDANAILNQAQTAVAVANQTASEADRESANTQNILNFINVLVVVFTAALFLAGIALGVFGIKGLDLEKRGSENLEKIAKVQEEIDKKKQDIDALQQTLIQDSQKTNRARADLIEGLEKIAKVQEEIDKKKQDIDELRQTLVHEAEKISRTIAYLILGNEFAEKGKNDQAIEAYKGALNLRPRDPQAYYALGRVYNVIGAYDKAIEHLTAALAVDADLPQAHKELGLAYRLRADQEYQKTHDEEKRLSEYNKAIEHLKHAIELLPGYEEAIASLAGTYRRLKMYSTALRYYKLTQAANPQSSYAPGNIAILALHEGDIQSALPAFEQTMELARKRIDAKTSEEPFWDYYDLGMAMLVLKKSDAIAVYKKAIELTPASGDFQSVLDGLTFLKEAADNYPIEHLDEVIAMVRKAKAEMEAQEKAM